MSSLSNSDFADDPKILERAAGGDQRALNEVFSHYRPRLRRMVELRMAASLRGRIDPSDVVQEAFLEASQRLPDYVRQPPLPFFLWLRRMIRDHLVSQHRRHLGTRARDPRREVALCSDAAEASSEGLAAHLLGHATSPSLRLARLETRLRLEDALNTLDPEEREILALRHFEQLTNSEAASELGIAESAASKRYIRALLRLRGVLETMNLSLDNLRPGSSA